MEVDHKEQSSELKSPENALENNEEAKTNKKQRLFSAKQFRKQLNSSEKLSALQHFLSITNSSKNHDYVFDYLEAGGSCLELLQILESDSSITPVLIFNLVTHILLRINANYPTYHNPAYESCRYIINNYLTVIHKMLGLSSSKEERRVCLKLLAAMVTFAPSLAKDVLLNVKFHTANIELLNKHTGEKDSVRDNFIHFLTAFLIDGQHQTLSILLEKSGLLTSIIKGLQYDNADTVCVVISAMKSHILENPSVSKTTKMGTFNTAVVKDIVNLYNWKGPQALILEEKKKTAIFEVDKYSKSKVSQCVHEFLLTLCTSHKFGVIFKDPLMGLGKKNQNSLMYTVLVSLDRPWEHSYAGELVVKICKACPDLTKNLWAILKPSLDPRLTEKWIAAMKFAKTILNELEWENLEFSIEELDEHQLVQLIQILVAPAPILKIICPQNICDEKPAIKYQISSVLFEMLNKINSYLNNFKKLLNIEKYKQLKRLLSNFVAKNFPEAQHLLNNWESSEDDDTEVRCSEYLEVVFDILDLYKNLAPQLLSTLNIESINLQEFLNKIENYNNLNEKKLSQLQIKAVGMFMDLDNSNFLPKTEIFNFVLPLLLKVYHEYTEDYVLNILNKLLKNTGIFEGCFSEVNIWLNGILNLDTIDDYFLNMLVEIIQLTSENIILYQEELSNFKINCESLENHSDVIQTLLNLENSNENFHHKIKHVQLSPLVLGFFKYLADKDSTKSVKKYSEFVLINLLHQQTSLEKFSQIITEYKNIIPVHIFEYCNEWAQGNPTFLIKFKGKFNAFKKFSEHFLNGIINDFLLLENLYPDFQLNILQTGNFYFSNLVHLGIISESQTENFLNLVRHLIKNGHFKKDIYLTTILENPVLLKHFSLLHLESSKSSGVATKMLIDIVKDLIQYGCEIERYLDVYRNKIFNTILKIIRKNKFGKVSSCTDILSIFSLEYNHCIEIIDHLRNILKDCDEIFVFNILCYCLKRLANLCQEQPSLEPFKNESVQQISEYLTGLNSKGDFDSSRLSLSLNDYFEVFSHQIEFLDTELLESLMLLEYKLENVNFCTFLLKRNTKFIEVFKRNIESIYEKKGVLLPLTQVLIESKENYDTLKLVYEKIEHSLLKALQKPQKVGQHFQKGYDLPVLIEKFMPLDKCKTFTEKVQKFEVAEVFHAKLLEAVFNKVLESEVPEKALSNIILTFIHLQISIFKRGIKSNEHSEKIDAMSAIFNGILVKLSKKVKNKDLLGNLSKSEVLKTYCKFCLKFGVSGRGVLLQTLTSIINIFVKNMEQSDAQLILEMLTSHSEFLDVVLAETSSAKLQVMSLFLALCQNWNGLMERKHVAVLLSAYNAKVTPCDRVILKLLKLYDSKADQTHFYDFKPFLWGRAAAAHYSVRTRIENAIMRQPKTSDVLDILKENIVNLTILSCPLNDDLSLSSSDQTSEEVGCYDLMFLLPLFSQLLAPEQQVKTYKFTRSGALSLTVMGLASQNEEVRQAACHVLSRFHFHLEARHVGKDNLLWIRYVEALCKGTARLSSFRLNNFAAIFFAKMALILTQPRHVMYFPLSRYLSAKSELDFSTVPELYTLLHSCEVNFKEHRMYILEILKDGLRTEKDFNDFLKSMAFKLISELYSSSLSDLETKLLILDVLESVSKIRLGIGVLCENHSVLSQLYSLVQVSLDVQKDASQLISKIVKVCFNLVQIRKDKYSNSLVSNILFDVIKSRGFCSLKDETQQMCFEVLHIIFGTYPELYSDEIRVNMLLEKSSDRFCKYVTKYGCKFITEESLRSGKDKCFYLRLLFFYKYR